MSVKAAGAAGQTRLLATSSVTRNTAGAQTLGASFTAAITIVLVAVDECRNVPYDSRRVIVSGRLWMLLAAAV